MVDILFEKHPFKLAVENTCTKTTTQSEDRKKLTNIVGCSLRHFYVFENLISRVGDSFNNEQIVALLLYLSNRLFTPLFSSEDINGLLDKYTINAGVIEQLDAISVDKTKLIPDTFSNESIEYLHYRFNVPLWVLKMWMSHFKGYTYKIVKSINRPINHFAFASKGVEDIEKLLGQYREIEKTETEGLYKYNGNIPPVRHSLFKNGSLISITPAEYYLLSKLDLDVLRKVAVYSEINSKIHSQLIGLVSKKMRIDYIAGTAEAYYPTKKDVELRNLVNTNVYEAGHSSIITCLSEKVHTMFVLPKNTNFAELRKAPDYFNRLDQSALDGYLVNQLEALNNASSFIENNGNLIYMVPTMDKKETIQIVEKFLKQHPEFVLVEQKQFLPFDKYDSTLYFAILRNEGLND